MFHQRGAISFFFFYFLFSFYYSWHHSDLSTGDLLGRLFAPYNTCFFLCVYIEQPPSPIRTIISTSNVISKEILRKPLERAIHVNLLINSISKITYKKKLKKINPTDGSFPLQRMRILLGLY